MALSNAELAGMMSRTEDNDDGGAWETPKPLFNHLDRVFHFGLDAAASAKNTLCKMYFDIEHDALKRHWCKYGSVWLNSPYGDMVYPFLKKAYAESKHAKISIACLVAARTETDWFQELIFGVHRSGEMQGMPNDVTPPRKIWLNGRVNFKNPLRDIRLAREAKRDGTKAKKSGSPAFPSVIVVYGTFPAVGSHDYNILRRLGKIE